jgi:tRNA-specific 2-thiouridylase
MSAIAVAMSGGVDSSVAAALLKEQGREVIGITLQLWPKGSADRDRHHGCCSLDAVEDARRVAAKLDIPYYVLDVQEEFNRRVVDPFLADYEHGRTPNPCISCNSEVKFDLLLRKAREIGAESLATGHYARIQTLPSGDRRLLRAVDDGKDQSYVLYGMTQLELAQASFPLGEWRKRDVRNKARELGLVTADKPDSVEICFVTSGDYRDLLAKRQAAGVGVGEIRHLDGTVVGRHQGVWNYTVGQRSGLGALPRGMVGPLFVLDLDAAAAVVTVGPREALLRQRLEVGGLTFVAGSAPADEFDADVRIRYGADPAPARVWIAGGATDGGQRAIVETEASVSAPAPGQAAVLYRGEEVLGGGRIVRTAA